MPFVYIGAMPDHYKMTMEQQIKLLITELEEQYKHVFNLCAEAYEQKADVFAANYGIRADIYSTTIDKLKKIITQ